MRIFIQRTIWFCIWIAAMALIMLVSWGMAKDQPVLLYTITLAMVVMSLGFVYSRQHWNDDNKVSAAAALNVGLLALAIIVVSEVSYWSSSIEGIHEQVVRERAGISGVDLVKERRRQQLARATSGKLPAEIKAEIAGAKDQVEARKLRAQLASAEELERLQGQVIADSTEVVNYSIRRSFYDAARLGSENIGGSIQAWISGITLLIVSFVLSLDAFALLIAFAPAKPREAPGRAEAPGAITVPPMPVPSPPVALEDFVRPSDPEPSPPPTKPSPKKEEETVAGYPPKPIDQDPRFSEPKKKTGNFPKSIAAFRKQYLKDAPGRNSDESPRHSVKGSEVWEFYSSLPGISEVKSQSGFGKKLAKLGVKRFQKVDGVHYSEVILLDEPMEAVA